MDTLSPCVAPCMTRSWAAVRRSVRSCLSRPWFDHAVLLVVVANCAFLAADDPLASDDSHNQRVQRVAEKVCVPWSFITNVHLCCEEGDLWSHAWAGILHAVVGPRLVGWGDRRVLHLDFSPLFFCSTYAPNPARRLDRLRTWHDTAHCSPQLFIFTGML
jgi:hypothetical protein